MIEKYLEKIMSKKENGLVKVITSISRCGKSYLLLNLYSNKKPQNLNFQGSGVLLKQYITIC